MAYISLSGSGLRVVTDYGQSDWVAIHNYNMTRLNNTLLKLSGLLDVGISSLQDGDVLQYNSSSQEWENTASPYAPDTTTTTTTSTTTTTTTTSTTV